MLKLGKYDESIEDFRRVDTPESQSLIASAKEALSTLKKADLFIEINEFSEAISLIHELRHISPYSSYLRQKRAFFSIYLQDYETAGSEFVQAFNLGRNVSYLYLAARSNLAAGSLEKGFSSVQACLRSDPDNPKCLALFRFMRNFDKQYNSTIAKSSQKIPKLLELWGETDNFNPKLHMEEYPLTIGYKVLVATALAEAYLGASDFGDSIKWAEIGLQIQDTNAKLLKCAIEAYFENEDYEKGSF